MTDDVRELTKGGINLLYQAFNRLDPLSQDARHLEQAIEHALCALESGEYARDPDSSYRRLQMGACRTVWEGESAR